MKSATIFLMKLTLSFLFIICIISNQQINAQPHVPEDMSMFLSYGSLYDFKYSPDGKILATIGSAGLLLWDMENHKLINNIVDTTDISCIDWGPDNSRIAISNGIDNIKIIDLYTCELLNEIKLFNPIYTIGLCDWSPDGNKIIAKDYDTIVVIDINTQERVLKFHDHELSYSFGIWSPDGNKIAFSRVKYDSIFKHYVEIYDIQSRKEIISQEIQGHYIEYLTWRNDNKVIVTTYNDTLLSLWDAETGNLIQDINSQDTITYVNFSPDGKYLACISKKSKNITLLNTENWSDSRIICNDFYRTNLFSGTPKWDNESSKLTYYGINKDILIREINSSIVVDSIKNYFTNDNVVKWSPDGLKIMTYQEFKDDSLVVKIWNANNAELIRERKMEDFFLSELSWSPDGSMIAYGRQETGTGYTWVTIYDTLFKRINDISLYELRHIYSVSWSPDGQKIAAGGRRSKIPFGKDSNIISLAYLDTNESFLNFGVSNYPNEVLRIAWSPDGTRIACRDYNNVKIFNSITGEERKQFDAFVSYSDPKCNIISWNQDGNFLAYFFGNFNNNNTIKIWDVQNDKEILIQLNNVYINSLIWSPNGKILAVGTGNGKILLYNTQNWIINKTLHDYPNIMSSLSWAPDSKKLASCQKGCIRIWGPIITEVVDKPVSNNIIINISPNPVSSSLSINYNVPYYSSVKLTVYDIFGNEIKMIVNEFQDGGNKNVESDISSMTDGIYFIKLQAGSEQRVGKFIKLK